MLDILTMPLTSAGSELCRMFWPFARQLTLREKNWFSHLSVFSFLFIRQFCLNFHWTFWPNPLLALVRWFDFSLLFDFQIPLVFKVFCLPSLHHRQHKHFSQDSQPEMDIVQPKQIRQKTTTKRHKHWRKQKFAFLWRKWMLQITSNYVITHISALH